METMAHMTLAAPGTLTILMAGLAAVVFIVTVVFNALGVRRLRRRTHRAAKIGQIMKYAMQTERVTALRFEMGRGRITNTVGNFLPEDGISTKEYIDAVHPDDRQEVSRFLTQLSIGRMSNGEVRYRRNTARRGEKPRWRYIFNSAAISGKTMPYDVVCALKDETDLYEDQLQEQDLDTRYRSIFERSIVGLAIYDNEGMLIAANKDMHDMMHMEGDHDPLFYDVNIFSRQPFRDIIKPDDVTELHFCTKMIVPERGVYTYMELQLTPQLDDVGNIQHYALAARDVTAEREFYLKNVENDKQIRRANEDIQRYETELQYLMDKCDMRVWRASFKNHEVTIYKSLSRYEQKLSIEQIGRYFVNYGRFKDRIRNFQEEFNRPLTVVCQMKSVFHNPDEIHWNAIDSIPTFDAEGNLEGCFGTLRNITPLIQAQEKLKEETRRANDSARLKSVFMANMTHEIRTPLNSIVGFSDLLTMIDDPEQKREMVRVIMNNCDMLVRLINDILEISAMDGSAIIISPEEVDFAKVFDDMCESLEQRVQMPTVTFVKDNPYATLTMSVDQRRVQQVVTNFVTNAVKYTRQGHIRVGYRIEDNADSARPQLFVYCEDTGAGIPKEKQASVFERFVKLNDYVQGTGLGLSICKAITDRCGGQIGVDSEGEGKGSTFWMRIPVDIKKQ